MKCKEFEIYYNQLKKRKITIDEINTEKFNEYNNHLDECIKCYDFYLTKQLKHRKINVKQYPCLHIAYHSTFNCKIHKNKWDCPDNTLIFSKKTKKYGIPIRDGGKSFIEIKYCPWCGEKIKNGK